jgi:hypothetical protein
LLFSGSDTLVSWPFHRLVAPSAATLRRHHMTSLSYYLVRSTDDE